ncbi:hypothetical protein MBH78_14915 [Oceanimonas sp. NS1]|nr:hypothetical protein [Oceanimonas sp. NS1]
MTELLPARLFAPLALSAVAALALLVWVLKNGDLCPGQRRRIGDGAISVWAVFGLALMLGVEAGVPASLLWLGGPPWRWAWAPCCIRRACRASAAWE